MPIVTIVMQKGKSKEYRKSILEVVHDSLVVALKIPDHGGGRQFPGPVQTPAGCHLIMSLTAMRVRKASIFFHRLSDPDWKTCYGY